MLFIILIAGVNENFTTMFHAETTFKLPRRNTISFLSRPPTEFRPLLMLFVESLPPVAIGASRHGQGWHLQITPHEKGQNLAC